MSHFAVRNRKFSEKGSNRAENSIRPRSLCFRGSCPCAGAPHLLDAGPEHPILRALAKMAQRGLGETFAGRESIDGLGRRVLGWVQKVPSANWLLGVISQP